MNWRCLIKHKWEYKWEEITHWHSLNLNKKVTTPTQVRLCQRCNRKQRSRGIDWVEWSLTLEEERDIKLRNILNHD
jgi:hypothetical protein